MVVSRDPVADQHEEAIRRLKEWGAQCGSLADEHGVARSSGVRAIIAHIQRAEQTRKEMERQKEDEKKPREQPRRRCTDCGYAGRKWGARVEGRWDRRACPECTSRYTVVGLRTALGKESKTPGPLSIQQLSYRVMEIDAIVATLPGWMQQPLRRRYCWGPQGQPDRFAADELMIDEDTYRGRLKAAERRVGEILATRRR